MGDVGVVGPRGEPQAAFILGRLPAHGARPVSLDTGRAPEGGLSLADGAPRHAGVDLRALPVVYLRRISAVDPARAALWSGWLRSAARGGQVVINPVEANDLHHFKPHQLDRLRAAGVPVPATLATTDPEALRRFRAAHAAVIVKPIGGGALARLLGPEDLDGEGPTQGGRTAVLAQEYVPGRDLRVYVLGDEAVAAGVIATSAVDYRADEGPVTLVRPAPALEELAVRAARANDCVFAALDLKWAADGRLVVLDCNPSPMFVGFDRKAGARVGERLAAFLAERARG